MASLIKSGKTFYAQFMVGQKAKRISLETESLQLVKDKLRTLESSLYRGNDNPFPTKTPIATVVTKYIENMLTRKTPKSAGKDISILRIAFVQICPPTAFNQRFIPALAGNISPDAVIGDENVFSELVAIQNQSMTCSQR